MLHPEFDETISFAFDGILHGLNVFLHVGVLEVHERCDSPRGPVGALAFEAVRALARVGIRKSHDAGEEGNEESRVSYAVSLPGVAQLRHLVADRHVHLRGAEDVDGSFPVTLDRLGLGALAVGRAEGAGGIARALVEGSACLEVSVDGDEVVCTELAVGGDGPRLGGRGQDVGLGGIQLELGVGEGQSPPHAPPALVLVQILAVAEYPGEVEGRTWLPPLVLESYFLHSGAVHEVFGGKVYFADCEHVGSHSEAVVRHSLGHPHGTGPVGIARSHVERPAFVAVRHHQRL